MTSLKSSSSRMSMPVEEATLAPSAEGRDANGYGGGGNLAQLEPLAARLPWVAEADALRQRVRCESVSDMTQRAERERTKIIRCSYMHPAVQPRARWRASKHRTAWIPTKDWRRCTSRHMASICCSLCFSFFFFFVYLWSRWRPCRCLCLRPGAAAGKLPRSRWEASGWTGSALAWMADWPRSPAAHSGTPPSPLRPHMKVMVESFSKHLRLLKAAIAS